jgi:hypothetical protein
LSARTRPGDQSTFRFEGFSTPNGTIVPDDVFDVLAPRLTEAELRVLLYVVRRTFGFGKSADAISLKQLTEGITARDGRILDYGTGMSRKGVIAGIKGLLEKGVINVHKRLDDRGENQVNVYTLRFRNGVVTEGNYGSNPSTLPGVTGGTPQDSVLQDSVEQQHGNPRYAPGTPAFQAARRVVVPDDRDPAHGRPDLYETMRDLGMHHHTASKLLREHDHRQIELMIEYVTERLQQGWAPQESVAAWLVASIRNRYQPPAYYQPRQVRADQAQRLQEQVDQQRQLAQEADQREKERVEAELSRQREGKLLALGIEQNVDIMWRQALELLRSRGEGSVALAMCFLKGIEGGQALVLVPGSLRKRVQAHEAALAAALAESGAGTVRVILCEMAG